MKKVSILIIVASVVFLHVAAQKKDKVNTPAPLVTKEIIRNPTEPEEDTYKRAVKYGDYEAAKNAIYSLIQKHPDNRAYLDSLTQLYFSLGAYPQCILAGEDFLQGEDSANTVIMELVAVSEGNLSRYKEALAMWERLWMKSGSDQYAYQVAVNQYLLKRYGECSQTIDIILKDPSADKETVSITDKNKSQKVAMKAAVHNLMGVIQKEMNMPDKAKESFEAALKIAPDFELAKNNLSAMDKKEEEKVYIKPKVPAKTK